MLSLTTARHTTTTDTLPLDETQVDPRLRFLDSSLMRRYRELYNVDLVHHVAGIMLNKVCVVKVARARADTFYSDDERWHAHDTRRISAKSRDTDQVRAGLFALHYSRHGVNVVFRVRRQRRGRRP